MSNIKKLVSKYLREGADKIDAGTSEVSEAEAIDILRVIAHEAMSREKASNYLNMSRSKFNALVTEKKLPSGQKRKGFREKVWYKDELDMCKERLNNN